jgi:hypothetical protein
MSIPKTTSSTALACLLFTLCGIQQSIAGVDPASPAQTPAPKLTNNSLEDPVLTNNEVKRLLQRGFKQETTSDGTIVYCRKVGRRQKCGTGAQLKQWPSTSSATPAPPT